MYSLTLSLPCLPRCHWKWPIKVPNLKSSRTLFPFTWAREKISVKLHSTESGFVIGPSNTLFAGVYVSTFQPRNFTGWGSEGVNAKFTKLELVAHYKAKDQNLETTLKIHLYLLLANTLTITGPPHHHHHHHQPPQTCAWIISVNWYAMCV